MTSLKEAIQYRIHQTSGQIRALKDVARTPRKANAAGIVHLDHISPKHPDWAQYSSLKQQASMQLTMLAILKHFGEVKGKESLRQAIRKGFEEAGKYAEQRRQEAKERKELANANS